MCQSFRGRSREWKAKWKEFLESTFAQVSDPKLHQQFIEKNRQEVGSRLINGAILGTAYLAVEVWLNKDQINEQLPFIIQLGSLCGTLYMFIFLSKC